jgi:hypothetical protein
MVQAAVSDSPRRFASIHRLGDGLGYTYTYFELSMIVTSVAFAQTRQESQDGIMDSGSTSMPSKNEKGRDGGGLDY